MNRTMAGAVIVAVHCIGGPAYAEVNMQEGNWETTIEMKMEIESMPFPMPPMTYKVTQCLTKKDMAPRGPDQPGQKCKMKDCKHTGSTVTWAMSCTDDKGGAMEGAGKVVYKAGAFDGGMEMTMNHGGQKMTMNGARTI